MAGPGGALAAPLTERYRIERELGAGGMATVYLAEDLRHHRRVAIKVLHPELSAVLGPERFLKEIELTANLQHPHILPLFDSGSAEGRLYYVMPYVEGETLRGRLAREKQLPIPDALRIATEIADALEYAHKRGVIHRDIKPENILLHDGHSLVADFGIALAVEQAGGSRMTQTGLSLGTPHYMSPEQAMGERTLDARTDVYALGAVTYEMLAGEPPFTAPTAQAVLAKVVTEEPPPLSTARRSVPEHVEDAVLTALEKLTADRFASAAEFAAALDERAEYRRSAGRRARSGRTSAQAARRPARHLSPAAIAGWAVALIALPLAAWGWARGRSSPATSAWQLVTLSGHPNLAADANSAALALSPDGSMLVFKADGQNARLFVKSRSALDPVPIPGTERAHMPAFSPDGRWIAFVADGQVKKVRATGGAVVSIADSASSEPGGVAWLDDGTVIYVTRTLQELRRVSEDGGTTSVVLAKAGYGGGVTSLAALPQARGVLFQVCSPGCAATAVYVLELSTGHAKLLLEDVLQAWDLPTRQLLYVRSDGVAMTAPFDPARLEVTGAAVPVLNGVRVRHGIIQLAWSPSGTLAYIRGGVASADEAEAVQVARDGTVSPVDSGWHGAINDLVPSPDGRRLAVWWGAGRTGVDIWLKQLNGGPLTRFTFGGTDKRPVWSGDGRMVAWIRDSAGKSLVMVRPADGSAPERVLARPGQLIQEIAWSRDGAWLVLRTDNGYAGAGDILAMRTTGDTVPVVVAATPYSELHPALSPDGRWVAYTSDESGRNEVYVRPFPNSSAGRWQVSNGGGAEARWSPGGRELFYLDGAARVIAAEIATAPTFSVSSLHPLFDASGFLIDNFHQSFAVTPSGTFLFRKARRTAEEANDGIVWVDNWFDDLRRKEAR
ncbi:MAG TPA: protein kinase [Gemmatimonadales bacterium]|nr:protein kinase [Gemmatimonadales bacterium]